MTVIISRHAVTKLSQLDIDSDKDWRGYGINNLGNLNMSGNFLQIGNGANLFRIQGLNDEQWHIVSSLYEDNQVKVSGTRWSFVDGGFDYHIGVGVTKDKLGSGYLLGMAGNTEFGMFSPLPYQYRQGVFVSVNPVNSMVEHVDVRVHGQNPVGQGWFGVIADDVPIPRYNEGYSSDKKWIALVPRTSEGGVAFFVHYQSAIWGQYKYMEFYVKPYQNSFALCEGDWYSGLMGKAKLGEYAYYDARIYGTSIYSRIEAYTTYARVVAFNQSSNYKSCAYLESYSEYSRLYLVYRSGPPPNPEGTFIIACYNDRVELSGTVTKVVASSRKIIYPQTDSATEPILEEGEMRLWKNTLDNTYWLIWKKDGNQVKVQLT